MEIQSNSPNECWRESMRYLLERGTHAVMYQRDCLCAENVTYVIQRFNSEELPEEFILNKVFSLNYPLRYKFDNGGIEIKRIYQHGRGKINQFESAEEVLKHGDCFSRAMIVIADTEEDVGIDGSPKCLTYIHFYIDGEDQLACICGYSVSNMAQFSLLDIYQLHNIQKEMSEKVNKKVGSLMIHCDRIFLSIADSIIYRKIFLRQKLWEENT